ncbi:type VII secretion integral membrane protein EccD [Streptomonospora nanhaiensis]|uniref:Type VII secretion integral membrane protein EccD n=1 Tax=Streptomonospora nanhaiensis TaxID=1323731 RepID=A0A853BS57_9ACTN|nr:type VII secretion integral membrane protein EccD [Streptomonospora nanhaiensis]MBV2363583.1 type VII secretion integral membrane protein EccD [Streptomonospora nanhaiensis]MBX9391516.1 type VII secretion integral membrane protein EccD [Streptomonospora nanhaiensis]NYI98599.1 type VII secretion integral membrane protein EccD [Streptomonospora nanhaiensis]
MNDPTASDLCRLLVRAPSRSFEIAAPTDIPVAELVPTLVLYAEGDEGEDLDEAGLEHDGWVLQQLGDEPLDEDETLRSLGLCHGETVYLRPRRDQLPPIHFDDLIDGVATGMSERPDRWRPAYTRVLLQSLALAALLGALLVPAAGGMTLLTAVTCAFSGLVMLASAWAASRAMGDLPAATGLAAVAALYLAVAGAAMPTGDPGVSLLGAQLLTGAMTAAGATVLGVAAVAGSLPFFTGMVVTEALLALGALGLMLLPNSSPSAVAAALALVALLVGTFAPQLAFRISGLRLPPLPANPEQLQQGIDPYPARDVLDRSALADKYQTALLAGTGAVLAGCLTVLAVSPGWVSPTVCVLVALVMLLQTRGLGGAWQRAFMTAPPCVGLAVLVLAFAFSSGWLGRSLILLGIFVAVTVLTILSWNLPGSRPLPHWGRAAEIIQSLITIAIFPLVLAAFGVFGALRAIGG